MKVFALPIGFLGRGELGVLEVDHKETQILVANHDILLAILDCILSSAETKMSNWILLGANVSLAILTFGLVWVTWLLVKEAREARIQTSSPNVVILFEQTNFMSFYDLVIQNVGQGIAYDVRITPTTEVRLSGDSRYTDLKERSFYSVSLLKPGQSIKSYVGRYDEIEPKCVEWTITYARSPGGTSIQANFATDISVYRDIGRLGPADHTEEIAKELKKLREELGWLARGQRKLQVDTYNASDRAAER
jgi:hypothetical protein